jgi:hypothetical protein
MAELPKSDKPSAEHLIDFMDGKELAELRPTEIPHQRLSEFRKLATMM